LSPTGEEEIEDLAKLVNPTGAIGLIGVYFSGDPRAVDSKAKQGSLWEKRRRSSSTTRS
jgi:hypothetical protein